MRSHHKDAQSQRSVGDKGQKDRAGQDKPIVSQIKTLLKMLELSVAKNKTQGGQVWTVKQNQQHSIPSLGRCCQVLLLETGDCFDMETNFIFLHFFLYFLVQVANNILSGLASFWTEKPRWLCNNTYATVWIHLDLYFGLARTGLAGPA